MRRLAAAGAAGLIAAATALPAGDAPVKPRPVLTRATTPLAHSNSHDGRAILTVSGMRPGDQRSGTVAIRNQGGAGGLAMVARAGGPLADRLRLHVADAGGGPAIVDTPLSAAPACTPAGDLARDAERTFRFTVTFDRGPDDNAYAGATARADFEWRDSCSPETAAAPLALGDVRLVIAPGPYRFSARTRTARVGVRCVAAEAGVCRGRIELERRVPGRGRGIAMAVGTIAVREGRRATVALRLNPRAGRHMARKGSVPVRAFVTVRGAGGRRHRVAYRDRLVLRR